jgi:Asp-tRNA(Asn)/Glu-tRNA(Gln) amidotransferase A subunit family amidase
MGRAFEEKALFQAAEAVEQITGLNNLSVLNKKEGNL